MTTVTVALRGEGPDPALVGRAATGAGDFLKWGWCGLDCVFVRKWVLAYLPFWSSLFVVGS